MPEVDLFLIRPSDTLRRAAETIDRNRCGIALIVDEGRRLLGTVTDGDLRRAMLRSVSLDSPAALLLDLRKQAGLADPVTAQFGAGREALLELMQRHRIRQVPIVGDDGQVVDVAVLDELVGSRALPITALVMAGGFGTRLRPLTDSVPKPLLPIGGKPLIETLVERLPRDGIRKITVATHYRAEQIAAQLGDGQDRGVEIHYVREDTPLGTAGVLSLLDATSDPLLVVNGDVLTNLDYVALYAFHREHEADMTVAVREYTVAVPFGVVATDGALVANLHEKPEYRFFVVAGVYLLGPSVRELLPATGQAYDMPFLINRLLEAHRRVASFPVREYWLDIGRLEDYERAQADLDSGRFQ